MTSVTSSLTSSSSSSSVSPPSVSSSLSSSSVSVPASSSSSSSVVLHDTTSPRSNLHVDYYSRLQEERSLRKSLQDLVDKYKLNHRIYENQCSEAERKRETMENQFKQQQIEFEQRMKEKDEQHQKELSDCIKRVRNEARDRYDLLNETQSRLINREKEEMKTEIQQEIEQKLLKSFKETYSKREEELLTQVIAQKKLISSLESRLVHSASDLSVLERKVLDQHQATTFYISRYSNLFQQMKLKHKYKSLCKLLLVKLFVIRSQIDKKLIRMRKEFGSLIEIQLKQQKEEERRKQTQTRFSAGRRESTQMIDGLDSMSSSLSGSPFSPPTPLLHSSSNHPSSTDDNIIYATQSYLDGDDHPSIMLQSELESWYYRNREMTRSEHRHKQQTNELKGEIVELQQRRRLMSAGGKETTPIDQQLHRLRLRSNELYRHEYSLSDRVEHLSSASDVLSVVLLQARDESIRTRKEAQAFVVRNTELHGELLIESREKAFYQSRVNDLEKQLKQLKEIVAFQNEHICHCARSKICICDCRETCHCMKVEQRNKEIIQEILPQEKQGKEEKEEKLSHFSSTTHLNSSSSPNDSSSDLLQANKYIRILRHRLYQCRSLLQSTQNSYDKLCAQVQLANNGPLTMNRFMEQMNEQQIVAMALANACEPRLIKNGLALPSAALAQQIVQGEKVTIPVLKTQLQQQQKRGNQSQSISSSPSSTQLIHTKKSSFSPPPSSLSSSSHVNSSNALALTNSSVDEATKQLHKTSINAAITSQSSSSSLHHTRSPAASHAASLSSPSSSFKSFSSTPMSLALNAALSPVLSSNNVHHIISPSSSSSSTLAKAGWHSVLEKDHGVIGNGVGTPSSLDLMQHFHKKSPEEEEYKAMGKRLLTSAHPFASNLSSPSKSPRRR